jgi:spermidine synthase
LNLGSKARSQATLFFFISGLTALCYEVVWLRLLGLVFGNTTFAVSTVLSAYMAGLGFGSYFISKWMERWKKPLFVYGCLEIGVGIYAALTPLLMAMIQKIYLVMAPAGTFSSLLMIRFALSFLIIFIPTFFMGGTLPVLVRFFMQRDKNAGSVTAHLYGLNTIGAVSGVLLSGFFLLPVLGLGHTLLLCVILNLGIGLMALLLSKELETGTEINTPKEVRRVQQGIWLPIALFVSGIAAMLYEVSWTRVLATVLGSSTYSFTIMLATFLLGIALGSAFCKKYLQNNPPSILFWGYLQITICVSALIALPLYPWVNVMVVRLYGLTVGHPNLMLFMMSLLCLSLMIVPAFSFGALFPMSVALYVRNSEDISRKVGFLYLWNTAGNIVGSLAAGFFLIPAIGIQRTVISAILMGAFLAAVAAGAGLKRLMPSLAAILLVIAVVIGSVWQGVKGWDVRLISSGLNVDAPRFVGQKTSEILSRLFNHQILFYREGLSSIVSVGQEKDNRYLKVNGKTDASTAGDMSTQLLLGHLPHLLHPAPERSLVIGFGSGATLAASLVHPVQKIDCVEIEQAVIDAAPLFDEVNFQAYKDPRAHIVINDGRNHLLMEKGSYDVVISEPSNPWMAGVSYLFTEEFYKLVDQKLNPDGVFCQWIHAYAIAPEDFWMVVATVRSVFPHVTLWRATEDDFLVIAQREPFVYPVDPIDARFASFPKLRRALSPYGITNAASLLARFQLGEDTVNKMVESRGLNTDDRLPLEFNTPKTLYNATDDLKQDIARSAVNEPLPPMRGTKEIRPTQDPHFLTDLADGYMGYLGFDQAKRYYQEAAALKPDDPDAMTGLARVLVAEGKELQAIQLLEESKTAEGFLALGRVYAKQGIEDKALAAFEASIAKDAARWEPFLAKAQSAERIGDWGMALEAYEACRLIVGPRLNLDLAIARARREVGDPTGALGLLTTLRTAYPMHYPIYQELKSTLIALDRAQEAIPYFEWLVKQNPYFAPYWVDLVSLYLRSGDERGILSASKESQKAQF